MFSIQFTFSNVSAKSPVVFLSGTVVSVQGVQALHSRQSLHTEQDYLGHSRNVCGKNRPISTFAQNKSKCILKDGWPCKLNVKQFLYLKETYNSFYSNSSALAEFKKAKTLIKSFYLPSATTEFTINNKNTEPKLISFFLGV